MDPEEVMNLFDSCWFNLDIFKLQSQRSNSETNPDDHMIQIQGNPEPRISRIPTIHARSKSEQLASSIPTLNSDFLSRKEVVITHPTSSVKQTTKSTSLRRRTKLTKSLSDLEFEELKGFMDLGFVFSEEDTDSSLVEIIPGLQRLVKKEVGSVEKSSIPRPYLSEAWVDLDRRNRKKPLMKWKVPDLGNDTDMKDSLKCWAHTVASAGVDDGRA
ncbi:uncharacterized protein LOC127795482 [Diospyros lotus]|uniref:uncharacterized protein LOC127795482 n=1 Tax=Diospyros lotus TaxID=55363 RepID=UPI0022571692|nr:uncharacterized protein LOC127795482 [Diospyros lotus]